MLKLYLLNIGKCILFTIKYLINPRVQRIQLTRTRKVAPGRVKYSYNVLRIIQLE